MNKQTLQAVIIDDEEDAVDVLKTLISDFCEDVDIVGSASGAIDGIKLIQQTSPDIVFLDIEMPGSTGFDVLEATPNVNYKAIFTTAYDHYAIKAIKHNALDYLMKPIDIDELRQAIQTAREQLSLDLDHSKVNQQLLNSWEQRRFEKIAITTRDGYQFIPHEHIQYLRSEGAYTRFVCIDNDYVVSKNLKTYESLLPDHFIRISNSHLINVNNIKGYLREDGGILCMQNGDKVSISRAKKSEVRALLGI